MAELDDLLSASLKRVAQPGDSTGVADAIRSRVDAGDTGAPANSSGFGGGGILPWLPWIGMVLVAGLTGASLSVAGVFAVAAPPAPTSQVQISTSRTVAATGCPGGAAVEQLDPGTRVLAIVRTEDSGYLGVRDPYDLGRVVWLPAGAVVVDSGEPSIDTLSLDGCAVAVEDVPVPVTPVAPVAPVVPVAPGPAPAPTPDTTAPALSGASANPNPIHQTSYAPDRTTVSVTATDNVGVASVTASWSTQGVVAGNSVGLSQSGSTWSFTFGPYATPGPSYTIPITLTARDAAGNQSSTVVNVNIVYQLN